VVLRSNLIQNIGYQPADTDGYGIIIFNTASGIITGNTISGVDVAGTFIQNHFSAQPITISNNTISNTGIGFGINLVYGNASYLIEHNRVYSSGLLQVTSIQFANLLIQNNDITLTQPDADAFYVWNTATGTTEIRNNTVTGGAHALVFTDNDPDFGLATNPNGLTFTNNLLNGSNIGIEVDATAGAGGVTLIAGNNTISGSITTGVLISGTGGITTTFSGGQGLQNTFVNNGPSGNANITVTAPFAAPVVNALWNDWNNLNLNQIENTIFHNKDNAALKLVNYFTFTAAATPTSTFANGVNGITYTVNITGFYGDLANAVISLTSTGAPNVVVPVSVTTDATGQATLVLTSTLAGTETITASVNGLTVTNLVTFTAVPQVVANKSSNPANNTVIGPSQPVTYVITVTPTASLLNVVITDSVPVNANYVLGSASASPGATLSGPSPFVVTVPAATAGQPITFTFAVTAPSTLNASLTFTNSARVSSTSTPISATNVITHFTGRVVRLRDSVWFSGYQVAINNASTINGDTLLGMAGNYTENLSLTKGVSLTGVASDTVVVRPATPGRVLDVSTAAVSNGVIISGMTFSNGSVGLLTNGAGIRISTNARLILNDVTVSNNAAGTLGNGGGVYADNTTILTVTNSAFLSNTANGSGGAIRADGAIAIANSSFSNNNSSGGLSNGGALSINNTGSILGSQFINNTAINGGAVAVVGGSSIVGTSAFTGNIGTNGGAIYASGNGTLQITGTLFAQNNSANGGGAILRTLTGSRAITVINSTFNNNVANSTNGGSAIYADIFATGNMTVQGSRFEGNTSSTGRGAIHFSSGAGNTLVITSSIFLGNSAAGAGAVRVDGNSNGLIVNSIFGRNSGAASPSAIEANNASLTIMHTTIASPTLSSLSAILINNTAAFVVNVTDTLVLSHSVGILMLGTGTVREDYNFFKTTAPTVGPVTSGGHSLSTGNANLVNVAADDYHLANGNLAIDSGTNVNINTDYDGTVRPRGLGVDIGALESPYSATVDLTLSKSVTPGIALPGQTVVFTLSARNINSVYAANGVVITDNLPTGILNPVVTSSGVPITQILGAPGYVWNVEPMLPGQSVLITVTGVITPDAANGDTFTNTARISSTTVDSNTTNNTASAAVQVGGLPIVSKGASPASASTVNPGDALVYTIVVTTQSDLSNLVITDSLPSGVAYVSSSGSMGVTSYSAPVVQLSVPFAPANTVITFIINATAPISGNLTFTNTANISSASAPGSQTTNPVSHTVAAPLAQFSSNAINAGESSGNAILTVTLSYPSSVAVTVNYTTSDGTALAGADYTGASSSITFAPGVTTMTIPVAVTADTIDENDETFGTTLISATNAMVGATNVATVTILDDDPIPTLQFSSATHSANEGDGTTTLQATLSNPSAFTVTVNYNTSDGTALAPADYVAGSGVVTFAPGAISANVVVSISEDVIDESSETFDVTLSGPTNATLGTPATSVVTIVDNDGTPTAQFDSASTSVGEGSGSALLTVTLSNPSVVSVTVTYNTSDNTALAPADYAASSGSVVFAPGATSANLSVPINEDVIDESTEAFTVTLTSATNATVGAPDQISVQIVDNDGVPTVQFASATANVNEGAGSATLLVVLSNPSVSTVTATYGTSSGSAVAGSDFVNSSGTITFAPGATSASVIVPISEDVIDESSETFDVALSNPGNATLGTIVTNTVTIIDNDGIPTVQFESASTSVSEGAGSTTLTVTLSNPSADTITVNYASANGAAVAGNDYTTATGTLTFTPGITVMTVNVAISEDGFAEGSETFDVALSNPGNATLGTPDTALIIILDNDGLPTVALNSTTYSVDEGAGNAVVTVTLSNASLVSVSVTYNTANGTAQAPGDYASSSGNMIFAPGTTVATATVPVVDDIVDESNETFEFLISGATNATLGTPTTATVTIIDNDGTPTAQFTSATYSADEGAGNAVLTITLSNPSVLPIYVTYHTSNGTALAGSDYVAATDVITFAAGTTTANVLVPVSEDAIDESNELFDVTLDGAVNAALGAPTTATVTIVDNDSAPAVQFSSASLLVSEGAGSAMLTATLSNPSVVTVTVNFATSDDTALASSDYVAASGIITFAPGTTLANVVVPISEDMVDESAEDFDVTLSNPTNATLGAVNQAGVTIIDNDGTPTAQFASASTQVSEAAGNVVLTVTLSNPSAVAITVTYNTSDGSAGVPGDYTAASGSVSFAPGATVATLSVPVVEDTIDESNETFNVKLTGATNSAVGTPDTAGVTIVDNDGTPTVSFSSANSSVSEGAGTAVIQVSLSNPSAATVNVSFQSSNGTAVAGSDYQTATGTISFAPGTTTATFVVTINEDTVDEADEVIQLALSNPSNATLGTPDSALLTIVDNDGTPSVRLSQANYNAVESDGSVMVVLELSNPSMLPVTVNYLTSNGTAVAGSDYTAASSSVTFAPGETTANFTVVINNDNVNEASETLNVSLGNPVNAVLGAPSAASVTIADDDGPPTIQFSQAGFSVNEKVGTVVLTVTLSRASDRPVIAAYGTNDGTAINGSDYIAISGTLSFAPGSLTATLEIPILDDTVYEGNETFQVTLTGVSAVGAPANPFELNVVTTASVTIIDDEQAPPDMKPRAYLPVISAPQRLPTQD